MFLYWSNSAIYVCTKNQFWRRFCSTTSKNTEHISAILSKAKQGTLHANNLQSTAVQVGLVPWVFWAAWICFSHCHWCAVDPIWKSSAMTITVYFTHEMSCGTLKKKKKKNHDYVNKVEKNSFILMWGSQKHTEKSLIVWRLTKW